MKKYLCLVLAVILSVSIAMCIGASAAEKITVNGTDWYIVSDDLLAESGLGDPAFVAENVSLDDDLASQWLGHEDWNEYTGWMGWRTGSAYFEGWSDTERVVVDTTLSDGSQGKAISLSCTNLPSPGEFALENLQDIIDLEVGKSYVAKVVIKVKNGNGEWECPPMIGWNMASYDNFDALTDAQKAAIVVFDADNEWHTLNSTVYTVTGEERGFTKSVDSPAGIFLHVGGTNMFGIDTEYLIESVQIFEVSQTDPTPVPTSDDMAGVIAVSAMLVILGAAVVIRKKTYEG